MNPFMNEPIDEAYIFLHAPECRTRREAAEVWLRNNNSLQRHATLHEDETILYQHFHPHSNNRLINRQVVLQTDGHIRKSVRSGQSSLIHEKQMLDLIRSKTTVPVPGAFEHSEVGQFEQIVIERMPGQTLETAWPTLSNDDKTKIADQILGYIEQWRQIQSPTISAAMINRDPLSHDFSSCLDFYRTRFGHFWDNADVARYVEQRCAVVEGQPFVFTHSDLDWSNILIDNGVVTAIIDFECSGFFPAYWEWISARSMTDYFHEDSWQCVLEKRLKKTQLEGWDGMWEVEQLCSALKNYAHESLSPEDRQTNRSEGWEKVRAILECEESVPPVVTYTKTHAFWLEYADGVKRE